MATKAELRKTYLEKQKALTTEERARLSAAITARFFESFDVYAINYLHCFIPIEKFSEVDTRGIFEGIWEEFPDVNTVVPRVGSPDGEMAHLRFTAETELVKNAWEINEPESGVNIAPDLLDIVVVPLLAYDEGGHRVGYGKGFYDRFLAKCRPDCLKIGLSYFPPVEKIDDAGAHDIVLDAVVTPEFIYRF